MIESPRRWAGRRALSQRADRLEAQLWPRDGFRFVCLLRVFFPLQQALHFVPGLQNLAAGARSCQGHADRSGQVQAVGWDRAGATLGCAAEGFLDSPRLEESSNRAGKMGLPPLPSPSAAV